MAKELTPQRKYQLKQIAENRCSSCGKDRGDSPYSEHCTKCAVKNAQLNRRLTGGRAWSPGSKGSIPLTATQEMLDKHRQIVAKRKSDADGKKHPGYRKRIARYRRAIEAYEAKIAELEAKLGGKA